MSHQDCLSYPGQQLLPSVEIDCKLITFVWAHLSLPLPKWTCKIQDNWGLNCLKLHLNLIGSPKPNPYSILPAALMSPLHAAILFLWGYEFPRSGLLSVGCKMYCSRMYMAYLYYELSLYNMIKMAERSADIRATGSMPLEE